MLALLSTFKIMCHEDDETLLQASRMSLLTMATPEVLCCRLAYHASEAGGLSEEGYHCKVWQHLISEHDCKGKRPVSDDFLGIVDRYIVRSCRHIIEGKLIGQSRGS